MKPRIRSLMPGNWPCALCLPIRKTLSLWIAGYHYGYNEQEERWEKTGLMRTDAMAFMMPSVSISLLKLPPEPMLDASTRFKEQGLNMNTFLMVEWVFIYTPDDFRSDDYTEQQVTCRYGGNCPRFIYEDPEFKGSYVEFDANGRLSKIYANVNNEYQQEDGTFEFDYDTPVSVTIPNAVEVKIPFQDILFKGMDVNDH